MSFSLLPQRSSNAESDLPSGIALPSNLLRSSVIQQGSNYNIEVQNDSRDSLGLGLGDPSSPTIPGTKQIGILLDIAKHESKGIINQQQDNHFINSPALLPKSTHVPGSPELSPIHQFNQPNIFPTPSLLLTNRKTQTIPLHDFTPMDQSHYEAQIDPLTLFVHQITHCSYNIPLTAQFLTPHSIPPQPCTEVKPSLSESHTTKRLIGGFSDVDYSYFVATNTHYDSIGIIVLSHFHKFPIYCLTDSDPLPMTRHVYGIIMRRNLYFLGQDQMANQFQNDSPHFWYSQVSVEDPVREKTPLTDDHKHKTNEQPIGGFVSKFKSFFSRRDRSSSGASNPPVSSPAPSLSPTSLSTQSKSQSCNEPTSKPQISTPRTEIIKKINKPSEPHNSTNMLQFCCHIPEFRYQLTRFAMLDSHTIESLHFMDDVYLLYALYIDLQYQIKKDNETFDKQHFYKRNSQQKPKPYGMSLVTFRLTLYLSILLQFMAQQYLSELPNSQFPINLSASVMKPALENVEAFVSKFEEFGVSLNSAFVQFGQEAEKQELEFEQKELLNKKFKEVECKAKKHKKNKKIEKYRGNIPTLPIPNYLQRNDTILEDIIFDRPISVIVEEEKPALTSKKSIYDHSKPQINQTGMVVNSQKTSIAIPDEYTLITVDGATSPAVHNVSSLCSPCIQTYSPGVDSKKNNYNHFGDDDCDLHDVSSPPKNNRLLTDTTCPSHYSYSNHTITDEFSHVIDQYGLFDAMSHLKSESLEQLSSLHQDHMIVNFNDSSSKCSSDSDIEHVDHFNIVTHILDHFEAHQSLSSHPLKKLQSREEIDMLALTIRTETELTVLLSSLNINYVQEFGLLIEKTLNSFLKCLDGINSFIQISILQGQSKSGFLQHKRFKYAIESLMMRTNTYKKIRSSEDITQETLKSIIYELGGFMDMQNQFTQLYYRNPKVLLSNARYFTTASADLSNTSIYCQTPRLPQAIKPNDFKSPILMSPAFLKQQQSSTLSKSNNLQSSVNIHNQRILSPSASSLKIADDLFDLGIQPPKGTNKLHLTLPYTNSGNNLNLPQFYNLSPGPRLPECKLIDPNITSLSLFPHKNVNNRNFLTTYKPNNQNLNPPSESSFNNIPSSSTSNSSLNLPPTPTKVSNSYSKLSIITDTTVDIPSDNVTSPINNVVCNVTSPMNITSPMNQLSPLTRLSTASSTGSSGFKPRTNQSTRFKFQADGPVSPSSSLSSCLSPLNRIDDVASGAHSISSQKYIPAIKASSHISTSINTSQTESNTTPTHQTIPNAAIAPPLGATQQFHPLLTTRIFHFDPVKMTAKSTSNPHLIPMKPNFIHFAPTPVGQPFKLLNNSSDNIDSISNTIPEETEVLGENAPLDEFDARISFLSTKYLKNRLETVSQQHLEFHAQTPRTIILMNQTVNMFQQRVRGAKRMAEKFASPSINLSSTSSYPQILSPSTTELGSISTIPAKLLPESRTILQFNDAYDHGTPRSIEPKQTLYLTQPSSITPTAVQSRNKMVENHFNNFQDFAKCATPCALFSLPTPRASNNGFLNNYSPNRSYTSSQITNSNEQSDVTKRVTSHLRTDSSQFPSHVLNSFGYQALPLCSPRVMSPNVMSSQQTSSIVKSSNLIPIDESLNELNEHGEETQEVNSISAKLHQFENSVHHADLIIPQKPLIKEIPPNIRDAVNQLWLKNVQDIFSLGI